jgi:hypothetical protein
MEPIFENTVYDTLRLAVNGGMKTPSLQLGLSAREAMGAGLKLTPY